jgi:hypothetical protein
MKRQLRFITNKAITDLYINGHHNRSRFANILIQDNDNHYAKREVLLANFNIKKAMEYTEAIFPAMLPN